MILGHERRRPLYSDGTRWHRHIVTPLRAIRRELGLTQAEHAELIGVPVNTFRMWDSGLGVTPLEALTRSQDRVSRQIRDAELVDLKTLADESDLSIHTVRAAVRTGRLEAVFSTRSVFGRLRRTATRAAAAKFLAVHYRRPARLSRPTPPKFPTVPDNFDDLIAELRQGLRLTQEGFAKALGAAGKAVVYQWESRKRRPSAIFWARITSIRPSKQYETDARCTSPAAGLACDRR